MTSKREVVLVPWTVAFLLLLSTTSAFSLMKHDTSPLFTKSFQVHSLSSQNYDTMLKESDTVWLVDYYAPWCPHCRHFAPEWERVANFYAKTDKVQVGAVDCTKNSEICNNENIHGYPGVKIHHVPADAEKAVMMPRGARGSKSVIDWAERLMEEHGIKSGVNIEDLTAQLKNFRNAGVAEGDDGEMMYNDQSLEMKYKRLHDAGIAVVSTFQNGFFMGENVLEGERYEVALMWVEALAASFPMKKNRQVLAMLVESMKTSNHWNHADWKVLLRKWKEVAIGKTFPVNLFTSSEDTNWAFCKTYTCGLWTLFHSITVSDVKASKKGVTQPWKPSRIMAAIRLYVKNFFGCEECREHFMLSNPESVIAELAASDKEGPHAVAMWIWKMHNTVNKSLKKQQWPSKTACPICYVENGEPISLDPVRLHEDEIVAYVTSAYGHDDEEIYDMDAAHNGKLVALWSSTQGFSAMVMILGFFALLGVAYKTRRHRGFDRKVLMMRDHIA
ncbi:hypothetical protein PC129_g3003 [Phytophthora cactorum]|nr:hypothetical protein Pcac1_g20683 [Phytophthora cactorum]KAG2838044.1 hypothetical protein PC112_g4670 [Phytophthora cactorum]KAG2840311.1 hypothetical protein PC111_g3528 [Phytophthora cactorum]KAG2864568.1 hypothetical protein PC113_g4467 [Phytophthora cactorum]KAG2920572.1 hypothetical protein PC114_g6071 [Phytophthora cactorum]